MLTFPIQFIKRIITLTQYHKKEKRTIDQTYEYRYTFKSLINKQIFNNNTITNCDLEYKDGSIAGKLLM